MKFARQMNRLTFRVSSEIREGKNVVLQTNPPTSMMETIGKFVIGERNVATVQGHSRLNVPILDRQLGSDIHDPRQGSNFFQPFE